MGLDIDVRHLPQCTRTAVEAAAAVGCELGQIVKSLFFECDGRAGACADLGQETRRHGRLGPCPRRLDGMSRCRLRQGLDRLRDRGTPRSARADHCALSSMPRCWNMSTCGPRPEHPRLVFEISSEALVRVASGAVADFLARADWLPWPDRALLACRQAETAARSPAADSSAAMRSPCCAVEAAAPRWRASV